MNTSWNHQDWEIKVDESGSIENYRVFIITTRDSRDEGTFNENELHTLSSIAEAMGCGYHIEHNIDQGHLEFWIS